MTGLEVSRRNFTGPPENDERSGRSRTELVGVRGFEAPTSTSEMRIEASELDLASSFSPRAGCDTR